jgi:translation initiation factor eIF-2B subunit delta
MTFATDRTSGSGDVALAFLDALDQWAQTDVSRTAVALRGALLPWLREAQAAQPTMALLHHLAGRAFEVADTSVAREDSGPDARSAIAQSCASERADLIQQREAVARTAVSLLGESEPWIATLSSSGLVRDALLLAHGANLAPRVLLTESRPLLEGRVLATRLARAGIPTWLVVDAALPLLAAGARMIWLGADAVTDRGVINKVGSLAAALAAREHSLPVYVLATRRQFLPSATPALKIREMAPEEVWPDAPSGVTPRNVYFELVPLDLIRGVVVEDGVLGSSEVRTVALDRPLPEALARG